MWNRDSCAQHTPPPQSKCAWHCGLTSELIPPFPDCTSQAVPDPKLIVLNSYIHEETLQKTSIVGPHLINPGLDIYPSTQIPNQPHMECEHHNLYLLCSSGKARHQYNKHHSILHMILFKYEYSIFHKEFNGGNCMGQPKPSMGYLMQDCVCENMLSTRIARIEHIWQDPILITISPCCIIW